MADIPVVAGDDLQQGLEGIAMNATRQQQLESVIKSGVPLEEIVALLRRYKEQGVAQPEVYSLLDALHQASTQDEIDDRVLEVADFVAGFCAPHMRVWEEARA